MDKIRLRYAALLMGGLAVLPGLAGGNLVFNADMSEDNGIGMPFGWQTSSHPYGPGGRIETEALSNGVFAVSAGGAEKRFFVSQNELSLLPGGKYELSCEVRTSGLGGGKASVFLRNHEWRSESQSLQVPDDTKGEWVRLTRTVVPEKTTDSSRYALTIEVAPKSNQMTRVEWRSLSLAPAGEAEEAASKPLDASRLRKLSARIVPTEPLLSQVDSAVGRMRFYWARSACAGVHPVLNCTVDGKREVRGTFTADGSVPLELGPLGTGDHRIDLKVVGADGTILAKNDYRIVVVDKRPSASVGRRLNNFVTELVNAPLTDGEVSFERSEDGWTWISFDGEPGDAKGYLDGSLEPVVFRREGEPTLEAQRYLKRGVHTLQVSGATGGRLRIHAVGVMFVTALKTLNRRTCDYRTNGRLIYALPFARRYGLVSTFNTTAAASLLEDPTSITRSYYQGRGYHVMPECTFWPDDKARMDADACYRHLVCASGLNATGIVINENVVRAKPDASVNFSEALWRLVDENPLNKVSAWYADSSWGEFFYEPRQHVSEIASIVNSGKGTGLIVPELYIPVPPDRNGLNRYVKSAAAFIGSARRMVPAVRGREVLYSSSYLTISDFCNYYAPQTDIKAHFAALMQVYATDPRFAGCAGLGFGGVGAGEEEFLRWGMKLMRYHGLEGGTENMADRYGYRWNPGFVQDPEFVEGLSKWTVQAADTGSLCAETLAKYGKICQKRVGVSYGPGDTVATFSHSEKGENVLSQRLSGLVPGSYYSLQFTVVDRNPMSSSMPWDWSVMRPFAFRAELEGGQEVPALGYVQSRFCRDPATPLDKSTRTALHNHRYVFRAESSTAVLKFVDRRKDGSGVVGGRLSLNYIIFRPFYCDGGDEGVKELIQTSFGMAKD